MNSPSIANQATRLAALRRQTDHSQDAVGAKVGKSGKTISLYERDPSIRIKMSVLQKLADLYRTTPSYIESGITNDIEPFNPMPPRVLVTDHHANEKILLVPEKAAAGYRASFSDQEYLGTLPTYSLPGYEHGTYRMFTVSGESMEPTLASGDIVIGEHVESPGDIKDRNIYVLVTTDGICVKRVLNAVAKLQALIIESDNPAYERDMIPVAEVLELWEFKGVIKRA